jgi:hypothetical protein
MPVIGVGNTWLQLTCSVGLGGGGGGSWEGGGGRILVAKRGFRKLRVC